jgi:hypothetical protein
LDKDAFLQLLVTQLRYQDPLNPMDDRDFIAQMAQFSALEQMMNLNNTFERSQAFSMIGRTVEGFFVHPETDEWMEIEGVVTAVINNGSETLLHVNGQDVPLSSVHVVSEDFMLTQGLNALAMHLHHARFQDMVGRHVMAFIYDSNGNPIEYVEGIVDQMKFAPDGQAVLVIGNREVWPHEIKAVGTGPFLIGATAFTNGDVVTGIDIVNRRAYVTFADGTRAHIAQINHAVEALAYVGRPISHGPISGTVQQIRLQAGVPFLRVYDTNGDFVGEINYVLYMTDQAGSQS